MVIALERFELWVLWQLYLLTRYHLLVQLLCLFFQLKDFLILLDYLLFQVRVLGSLVWKSKVFDLCQDIVEPGNFILLVKFDVDQFILIFGSVNLNVGVNEILFLKSILLDLIDLSLGSDKCLDLQIQRTNEKSELQIELECFRSWVGNNSLALDFLHLGNELLLLLLILDSLIIECFFEQIFGLLDYLNLSFELMNLLLHLISLFQISSGIFIINRCCWAHDRSWINRWFSFLLLCWSYRPLNIQLNFAEGGIFKKDLIICITVINEWSHVNLLGGNCLGSSSFNEVDLDYALLLFKREIVWGVEWGNLAKLMIEFDLTRVAINWE